ncbi:hypothetical protein AB0K05_22805 [Nonomuraea sp. NPDC049486]|uniref:hypothetical protein n=1 Tax=Nonomuraea sp. NPDC049486 TaxID=3155773 RepID=UPI003432FA3A
MTETHKGEHHAFIAQLIELREAAGQPSYGRMNRLSRAPGIPKELPTSTLSDILNGKRERLPDWELVSSFVTVCHRHAEQTGLPVAPLGTVPQWQARWLAARKEPRAQAGGAYEPRTHTTGTYDLYRTPAEEADRRTSRMVAYLVRRAAEGDSEPAYRLAIIKALLGEVAESRHWAYVAVQRRHPGAEAFDRHRPPIDLAADLAFAYGRAYEQEGPSKLDIARAYYRLAAGHGHLRAAERLRAMRAVPFGKLLPAPLPTDHRPGPG